jgi:hypothetical protein
VPSRDGQVFKLNDSNAAFAVIDLENSSSAVDQMPSLDVSRKRPPERLDWKIHQPFDGYCLER